MRREGRARSTCLGRVWGPEADIRCLPLLFSVLFILLHYKEDGVGVLCSSPHACGVGEPAGVGSLLLHVDSGAELCSPALEAGPLATE